MVPKETAPVALCHTDHLGLWNSPGSLDAEMGLSFHPDSRCSSSGAWCSSCAQDRGLGQEGAGTASDWYLMFQNLITATSACGLNCIVNPQTSSTRSHVRDPMRAVPAVFIPSPALKIPGHLLRFPCAMSLHSESISGAPSLGWLSLL